MLLEESYFIKKVTMTPIFFHSLLEERASSTVCFIVSMCAFMLFTQSLSAEEYHFLVHVFGKQILRCTERDISEHLQKFDRENQLNGREVGGFQRIIPSIGFSGLISILPVEINSIKKYVLSLNFHQKAVPELHFLNIYEESYFYSKMIHGQFITICSCTLSFYISISCMSLTMFGAISLIPCQPSFCDTWGAELPLLPLVRKVMQMLPNPYCNILGFTRALHSLCQGS